MKTILILYFCFVAATFSNAIERLILPYNTAYNGIHSCMGSIDSYYKMARLFIVKAAFDLISNAKQNFIKRYEESNKTKKHTEKIEEKNNSTKKEEL